MDSPETTGDPRAQPPMSSPTFALIALGRALEARANGDLEDLGLSLRRMGALGHLTRDPGLSYTELAQRARVRPQSMHATIAGLIDIGAVRPTEVGRGRRALLEVTEEGRRLLGEGRAVIDAVDEWARTAVLRSDPHLARALGDAARRLVQAPSPGA